MPRTWAAGSTDSYLAAEVVTVRIRTDDILFRVDRTWLGPKILRFPWRATYQAYAIGVLVMASMAFIGLRIGLPINVVTVTAWVVTSLIVTHRITRALDPDRPIRAALARLGQELTAPRPVRPKPEVSTNVLTVARWRFGAEPERRRLFRWARAIHSAIGRGLGAALMRLGGVAAVVGRFTVRRSNGIRPARIKTWSATKNRAGAKHGNSDARPSLARVRPLRPKIKDSLDAVPEEDQEAEDQRPDIYSATR